MAAAMENGGDGCARGSQGREGKREPEEGERSRGSGENEGRLWVSPWRREDVGEAATAKKEVEASACARACVLLRLCLLAEVEDDWQVARWAGLSSWAAQVKRPRW